MKSLSSISKQIFSIKETTQHEKSFLIKSILTSWHFKTGSQSEKRFIQNMIKSEKNLKHLNAMVRSNMEYKSLHTPSLFIKKDSWHALLHKNKWFAAFELDMFQHVWVCNPAYSCTLLQETNWLQNFHFNFRG